MSNDPYSTDFSFEEPSKTHQPIRSSSRIRENATKTKENPEQKLAPERKSKLSVKIQSKATQIKEQTTNKPTAEEIIQEIQIPPPTEEQIEKIKVQQATQNTLKNTETQTENHQTQAKMNQKEMQQTIASFVPEFSGEEAQLTNALTRFTGTSDSIYETLTNEERGIFNKLIKFRLTGDAYMRISRRDIKDYPTIKTTLNSMYQTTMSLDEMEKKYTNIQQNYGETIRNYGYRLTESIEQYKNGYKTNYNVPDIDRVYQNHLNAAAVQTFKRGLNNTILKEKVATFKTQSIDEIIEETETIEKRLTMATDPPTASNHQNIAEKLNQQTQILSQNQTQNNNNLQKFQRNTAQIICNFCNKPNHTWDVCRTRISTQNSYNTTPRFYRNPLSIRQPNQYHQNNQSTPRQPIQSQQFTPRTQQPNNHLIPRQQYNPQNQHVRYLQTPNFTTYRQSPQYQPKYCSHCKNTTGHTFEECRSKFYGPRDVNTNNYARPQQQQPPNGNNLEAKFTNMRINPVFPQDEYINSQPQEETDQENPNGSSRS